LKDRNGDTEFGGLADEDLARAVQRGGVDAFDEIVRRHQARLYAIAYRITGNREDALDVTQDALLKAFRRIGQWQPVSGFLPWLLRLTTNTAIDHVRWRSRRRHEPLEPADQTRGDHAARRLSDDPAVQARAGEIDGRVQRALVVLSPTQRAVFVMRHYEGLQLSEIADVLGCTVGSVKVHLFRAVRKLQAELKDLI
jgi:RNA polymerase sigma-70 factor (ECF subfamily)